MSAHTIDQLLAELVQVGVAYGEAIENDKDACRANKQVVEANKIMAELEAQNAQERVLSLLEFAHVGVRLLVAGLALRLDPERATAVLQNIRKGQPRPIRAMAYSQLAMWLDSPRVPDPPATGIGAH